MKGSLMYVVTADQRRSREDSDQVPQMLALLAGFSTVRAFERTAGDEIQGVLDDPAAVVGAVVALLRARWWAGVGVGEVDRPLPRSARAGRGPAYVAARQAVEAAKSAPGGIAVGAAPGPARPLGEAAEAAAWLLAAVLGRRTPQGWQVVDLVSAGATGVEAAAKLGITPQAVSSRLRVAGWAEEQRGRDLLAWLLACADAGGVPPVRPQED